MSLSFSSRCRITLAILILVAGNAAAAGVLQVEQAWIRAAPLGARMLAGYATLANVGDAPLVVARVSSPAFGDVSLHESMIVEGIAKMRPLERIVIAPGERVPLAPGGKHLMLMRPADPLAIGAEARITFELDDGAKVSSGFIVREDAPH